MNWYIGQSIVCIDPTDKLIKNSVYQIKGLRESPCTCRGVNIDVGHYKHGDFIECSDCGMQFDHNNITMWFHECQFVPLDELADISELTEVLNEPIFKS